MRKIEVVVRREIIKCKGCGAEYFDESQIDEGVCECGEIIKESESDEN